ncbi:ribosomally synthesized peptide (two-chain TOMM family) [Flavobacterium sp. 270]|uniref:NHLP leader peptide family RiPP precursor n=1 Tax=Flavobacterium sp. 270 TaxID=2512114 RepID=UPI00106577C3|nr:NHLP leader peptide family RiPP precursor [Flavobacterium sp. 270]TDW51692.1 ribosomally synthesized peptide (two-chain TOMM family) [Flavobacterium sp. 270]
MILTEEQKKGQDVFFRIIAEAWENDDFKKSLLKNPEKTLEAFFGRRLPIGKKIKVTDQSDPEFLYINIPIKMQQNDQELDEKKLDNCGGGTSANTVITDFGSLYDSLRDINK